MSSMRPVASRPILSAWAPQPAGSNRRRRPHHRAIAEPNRWKSPFVPSALLVWMQQP